MTACTGDFMTCPFTADHTPDCGWHPDNCDVTYVSDAVWADIMDEDTP